MTFFRRENGCSPVLSIHEIFHDHHSDGECNTRRQQNFKIHWLRFQEKVDRVKFALLKQSVDLTVTWFKLGNNGCVLAQWQG